MARESQRSESFDLAKLRELIEVMEQHGVTEVNLARGDEQWKIRRGPRDIVHVNAGPGAAISGAPVAAPLPAAPAAPAAQAAPAAAETPADNTILIKSPTVGTFYAAPSPDDPPFVTVGSRVNPDTVVCVVEAMKVFNQIVAEVSGTVAEVLVHNGDAVEYGQPLFRVRPV